MKDVTAATAAEHRTNGSFSSDREKQVLLHPAASISPPTCLPSCIHEPSKVASCAKCPFTRVSFLQVPCFLNKAAKTLLRLRRAQILQDVWFCDTFPTSEGLKGRYVKAAESKQLPAVCAPDKVKNLRFVDKSVGMDRL